MDHAIIARNVVKIYKFMINPLYHRARFTLGAAQIGQLPQDEGYEVAFVGRSNVGKSSALNVITNQKSLARTSKTPGRTQQINFFDLDEQRRFADLPGYGYAKVPEAVRRQWEQFLGEYLEGRQCLRGIVALMDIRHPLTDHDHQMLSWCCHAGVPACVLLTKADKLKRGPAANTYQKVKQTIAKEYGEIIPRWQAPPQKINVILFSSLKKQGVEDIHKQLDIWYEIE